MKLRGLARRLRRWLRSVSYSLWIRRYDSLDDEKRGKIAARISAMPSHPLISVVMPVCDPPLAFLEEAIRSVREQLYPHWELCIADDASRDPAVIDVLRRHAAEEAKIKLIFREERGHISHASNSALALAKGEFVALMDHDDLLPEEALFWAADAILKNPGTALIYSDEDRISEEGRRYEPHFKCDWNAQLFLGQNFISHLGLYGRKLLGEIGGFRPGFEGSQDYDLALRCIERIEPEQVVHIARVLYHWRAHPASTAQSIGAKPYAVLAGEKALNEHLARSGSAGRVTLDTATSFYRFQRDLPDPAPLVSIVINSGDAAAMASCQESLKSKTAYPNLEILMLGENLAEALEKAKGPFILFLDAAAEAIEPAWLGEMMAMALQAGVGAVGAKLLSPAGRIVGGGQILGAGDKGLARNAFAGLEGDASGYFFRPLLAQDFSALSGSCLLVSKENYLRAGGLDLDKLGWDYGAVDFCLKLKKIGLRNVWTPYARLRLGAPAWEGAPAGALEAVQASWDGELSRDAAYSPNLDLKRGDFSLAWPPRVEQP